MKRGFWFLALLVFAVSGIAVAQRGQPQPELAPCGPRGEVEIVCGAVSPEDFEIAPGGGGIIVAQFGRGAAAGAGLVVFRSEGGPRPISGVSVAIQYGDDVYVGSFQGDRVVRLDWID